MLYVISPSWFSYFLHTSLWAIVFRNDYNAAFCVCFLLLLLDLPLSQGVLLLPPTLSFLIPRIVPFIIHPGVDRETGTKRTTATIRLRAKKCITMASSLYADSPASSTSTILDKIEQRWNPNKKRNDYTYHYDLTQIDNDSIDESVVVMDNGVSSRVVLLSCLYRLIVLPPPKFQNVRNCR
jgi:hypothetical protein